MRMPKLSVAYSINDDVGRNVANLLASINKSVPTSYCKKALSCYNINGTLIGGFEEDTINFDFLDKTPDEKSDIIIVISKHQSTSNMKTLSLHHTGNPSPQAPFGGRPMELSYTIPAISKAVFKIYYKHAINLLDYNFTLEATHHGPTSLLKPLLFIEIGSTKDEWNDRDAVRALGETIREVLELEWIEDCIPSVGFGSTHYPAKFTRIELEEKYCFGHIISKYYIDYLNRDIIVQAIEKSIPRAEVAFIEKKGVRSQLRRKIELILNELGLEVRYV